MSTPIKLNTPLFPAHGFNPGSGVLAVRLADGYADDSRLLEEAVQRAVPVVYSYGRPSPYVSGKGRNFVYSYIGQEIRTLYEAWNRNMHTQRRTPIVNRTWVDEWLERMNLDKDEVINNLGVAQPCDNICVGVTPRGGYKLVVNTFEGHGGTLFESRWGAPMGQANTETKLMQMLTDIAVLTALARLNRMAIYYAMADAAGWSKSHTDGHQLTTLTDGICYDLWEVHSGEVRVPDGEAFLFPADTDSWLVCQAPKGERNTAQPWRVIHTEEGGEPSTVRNRIDSIASVTALPPENSWTVEYSKERGFP